MAMTPNEFKTAKIAIAVYEAAKRDERVLGDTVTLKDIVDAEAYECAMRVLALIDVEKSDIDIKCPYYPCKETNNE